MDATTAETLTVERLSKKNERTIRDMGYGATVGGVGLTKRCLKPLSQHISLQVQGLNGLHENDPSKHFLRAVRELDPDVIALCALQGTIHGIAQGYGLRDLSLTLGRMAHDECYAAGLLKHDGKLAGRIERAVRKRHGSLKYRKQAARSIAKRAGFKGLDWSREDLARAGTVLLEFVTQSCGWAFALTDQNEPVLTPEALDLVEEAFDDDVALNPVLLPLTEPPVPWMDHNKGGYPDLKRARRNTLVRTWSRENVAAIRAAIKDGSMQPTLDAVNSVQNVAFKINQRVLEVLKWCDEHDIAVAGLPRRKDLEVPARPADWDNLDKDKQRAWRIKAAQVHTRNRGLVSDRVLFAEDVRTAELLMAASAFWTPCNLDWRGRVYPLPHFNFQRDDRVRGLFLFTNGLPIGEDGLWWLKVHLANCGDFGKISKQPLEKRVQWVNDRPNIIRRIGERPLDKESRDWWTRADKPFLFLAACMELTAALKEGPTFVTHLPVSFDGSCSGLQHLCAMTRAPEGFHVNLVPCEEPQDVYDLVAGRVLESMKTDRENPDLSKLWINHGISRKLVKRNTMTYSYSSKTFGMADQHMEDLMKPLGLKVLDGELSEHPFATQYDVRVNKDGELVDTKPGTAAAKFLAKHVYREIEALVPLPAEAMGFLQRCARALAHEGKPLEWRTPTGLPWSNRYHVPMVKDVELWLNDVRVRMRLTVGDQKEIDKDKAANGVAPNFVHACDAAHLMLTVNAAVDEGITDIATVHDSFGCLAPHARRFNQVIREQFVQMYEQHDVLAEVLERANCDLTVHNTQRLPDPITYGGLNLKEVENARYAFA